MYNFQYHKPDSLDAAVTAIAGAEDGKIVAGGMTLLPTMKQRLAAPTDLVDLSAIPDLKGICLDGDTLLIGAMTTHAEVAHSDIVKGHTPALAGLAEGIGDPQVRNRGTIGGSIANNDPTADYPAAVLGLNATVRTTKREIAADDFFEGLFTTALEEDELIVSVAFPKPAKAAYVKFPNPASRYAMVGVLVALTDDHVRVAITGAGQDGVFRASEMEAALSADFSPQSIEEMALPAESLNADIHGSAEYRSHLVTVMAKRAVAAATG